MKIWCQGFTWNGFCFYLAADKYLALHWIAGSWIMWDSAFRCPCNFMDIRLIDTFLKLISVIIGKMKFGIRNHRFGIVIQALVLRDNGLWQPWKTGTQNNRETIRFWLLFGLKRVLCVIIAFSKYFCFVFSNLLRMHSTSFFDQGTTGQRHITKASV